MKKRFISGLLTFCMLFSAFSLPIYAAQKEPLLPQWINTSIVTTILSFDGTTGYAEVGVTGYSDVTNITADIELYFKTQMGTWIQVTKDWHYDVDQQFFAASETFAGVPGREYKIVLTATVTNAAGVSETITDEAYAICPTAS